MAYVQSANEISARNKISWNLSEFTSNVLRKRDGVEVDDGPSVSATMGNDWKPRLRGETARKPFSHDSMNPEVYIRRLNKTVWSNQHNDRGSTRCFVGLSEAALIRERIPRSSSQIFSVVFVFPVHPFLPPYLFHFPYCGHESSRTEIQME